MELLHKSYWQLLAWYTKPAETGREPFNREAAWNVDVFEGLA
tara:strand:- start:1002 stop:1127 length:126 start_codon:yes stop_codon:yes gene_type:complete